MAESIASDDMFDCYLEPVPGIGLITRRRPGLVEFADIKTSMPGLGLYYWDFMQAVIAVSGGNVFRIWADGTSKKLDGMFGGSAHTQAQFADGQKIDGTPWLYIAATGLNYTTDGVAISQPTDINTPNAHEMHLAYLCLLVAK